MRFLLFFSSFMISFASMLPCPRWASQDHKCSKNDFELSQWLAMLELSCLCMLDNDNDDARKIENWKFHFSLVKGFFSEIFFQFAGHSQCAVDMIRCERKIFVIIFSLNSLRLQMFDEQQKKSSECVEENFYKLEWIDLREEVNFFAFCVMTMSIPIQSNLQCPVEQMIYSIIDTIPLCWC